MSNNDTIHETELPKFVDDGIKNNYSEWELIAYRKLREWELLKYIEGPASQPPVIPPLRHTVTHHDRDADGRPITVYILGNEAEHEQALKDAEPWMTGNNTALARIVCAIPSHRLYLVKHALYAKQAWESLRSEYTPRSSLCAVELKRQITSYRCPSDMDIAKWLTDMQWLYSTLCKLGTDMSDHDFAFAILDLMPLGGDEGWTDFLIGLRMKVHYSEAEGLPIHSATFVKAIQDYRYRHYDDRRTRSHIFSARFEVQRRTSTQKRARTADIYISSPPRVKRARADDLKPYKRCTNPHCTAPSGHETPACVSYRGAMEGQYHDWWRGPWNIHLPPSQRTKRNNVPPRSHPIYREFR